METKSHGDKISIWSNIQNMIKYQYLDTIQTSWRQNPVFVDNNYVYSCQVLSWPAVHMYTCVHILIGKNTPLRQQGLWAMPGRIINILRSPIFVPLYFTNDRIFENKLLICIHFSQDMIYCWGISSIYVALFYISLNYNEG